MSLHTSSTWKVWRPHIFFDENCLQSCKGGKSMDFYGSEYVNKLKQLKQNSISKGQTNFYSH
jgi:hypothetical protein